MKAIVNNIALVSVSNLPFKRFKYRIFFSIDIVCDTKSRLMILNKKLNI